ncbi:hypothetical protein PENTCL1PPCAC_7323, partial [Pristionchus entomophagus]
PLSIFAVFPPDVSLTSQSFILQLNIIDEPSLLLLLLSHLSPFIPFSSQSIHFTTIIRSTRSTVFLLRCHFLPVFILPLQLRHSHRQFVLFRSHFSQLSMEIECECGLPVNHFQCVLSIIRSPLCCSRFRDCLL